MTFIVQSLFTPAWQRALHAFARKWGLALWLPDEGSGPVVLAGELPAACRARGLPPECLLTERHLAARVREWPEPGMLACPDGSIVAAATLPGALLLAGPLPPDRLSGTGEATFREELSLLAGLLGAYLLAVKEEGTSRDLSARLTSLVETLARAAPCREAVTCIVEATLAAADYCLLARLGASGDRLLVEATAGGAGPQDGFAGWRLGEGLPGRVILTGREQHVQRLDHSPLGSGVLRLFPGAVSAAAFPTWEKAQPAGCLLAAWPREHSLSRAERSYFRSLAYLAGNALHARDLAGGLARQERQRQALGEAIRVTGGLTDFAGKLDLLAGTVSATLEAEITLVLIPQPEDDTLRPRVSRGLALPDLAGLALPRREAAAAVRRAPEDTGSNLCLRFFGRYDLKDLAEYAAVRDGEVQGMLVAASTSRRFTPGERELLGYFGLLLDMALQEESRRAENERYFRQTTQLLTRLLDAKSAYGQGHARRVSELVARFSAFLGIPPRERERLVLAGILHDVGRVGIPDAVLDKEGPYDTRERRVMQEHVSTGCRLLEGLPFAGDILPVIAAHHEWYDGTGYPAGARGEDIPPGARLLAICDAFEAMTAPRAYRRQLSESEALRELRRCAGTQFDPALVEAFVAMVQAGREAASPVAPAAGDAASPDLLRRLSAREREVYALLAQGCTNREIAALLCVTEKTVKAHVSSLLRKLEVNDRTKAAVLAWRNNWFAQGPPGAAAPATGGVP